MQTTLLSLLAHSSLLCMCFVLQIVCFCYCCHCFQMQQYWWLEKAIAQFWSWIFRKYSIPGYVFDCFYNITITWQTVTHLPCCIQSDFFHFVFNFSRENATFKTIDVASVIQLLPIVLDKNRAPHLEYFLEFLTSSSQSRITTDQWDSFLQFNNQVAPDLSNYEEDGACEWILPLLYSCLRLYLSVIDHLGDHAAYVCSFLVYNRADMLCVCTTQGLYFSMTTWNGETEEMTRRRKNECWECSLHPYCFIYIMLFCYLIPSIA